jgi:hypothetical protein
MSGKSKFFRDFPVARCGLVEKEHLNHLLAPSGHLRDGFP